MGPTEHVLVLCTANVARSPLAAALLRARLDDIGRADVSVSSAGLQASPGQQASAEASQVAASSGLDLSRHLSDLVSRAAVARSALVLTMTEPQRAAVDRLAAGSVARTFTVVELGRLLRGETRPSATIAELARRAHRARPRTPPASAPEDVADPIGRSLRFYQRTADQLARALDELVAHLGSDPGTATPVPEDVRTSD